MRNLRLPVNPVSDTYLRYASCSLGSLNLFQRKQSPNQYSYDRAQREVIQHLAAVLPGVQCSVFTRTSIEESVYLCYLTRCVITADESDMFWILDFVDEEEKECFDRVEFLRSIVLPFRSAW